MAKDRPAIAGEVLQQTIQFGAELRGVGVVHDQDHFAAVFDERHVDSRLDVTVAVVTAGILHDGVFISRADSDAVVNVARGAAGQRGAAAPRSGRGRFPINGVAVRRGGRVLRPGQGNLRRRYLDR